jgi:hypothetical protein
MCRNSRGSMLVFITACTFVIVLIGVGAVIVSTIMGGHRELGYATDSGNLNVAKTMVKGCATVLKNSGPEQDFAGLVQDTNGRVDLVHYNRIIGQSLLVALNAESEDTPAAKANAQTLLDAVQTGSDNISKRLQSLLSDPGSARGAFVQVAGSNSLRMLGSNAIEHNDASYQTAYLEPCGSTNIYLDSSSFP